METHLPFHCWGLPLECWLWVVGRDAEFLPCQKRLADNRIIVVSSGKSLASLGFSCGRRLLELEACLKSSGFDRGACAEGLDRSVCVLA